MNRIVHFEIHSEDIEASKKFFGDVFGWKFHQFGNEPYWMTESGKSMPDFETPGIDGGFMPSRDGQPRTVNTIDVESVDAHCDKIRAHGGQIVVDKMPIPGVGYIAYALDPQGVLFGVYESDESASA